MIFQHTRIRPLRGKVYVITNHVTLCAIKWQLAIRFFYHSCCKDPGIMGIAVVSKAAYPDATQFNRDNKYFDPKATVNNPRWFNVEITLVKRTRPIPIKELRQHNELSRMRVLQTGNRLSITPVDPAEWQFILAIL